MCPIRICPVCLLAVGLLAAGCRPKPPSDLPASARSQADLATDTAQARLWGGAADRAASAPAVARPVDTPVAARRRVEAPSRQVAEGPVTFPAEMRGGLRLTALPELPAAGYAGPARVAKISGEQLDLEFGGTRLSLLARVRGGPLRLKEREEVRLELRTREEPANRQRIVALRSPAGEGIVSALETGREPVSVSIKLFELVARQTGRSERGTMPVEVTVRGERRMMTQGELVDFKSAGLTVGLVGSTALTGPERFQAEGNPYAIDLIAWPTK